LYLEALIAPDTITTVPPATMDAFRDHGRVQVTLGIGAEAADAALESAAALGLDLHAMTEQLQADALTAFASSFDQLLATLAEKRRRTVTAAT
jgi:transaldolase